MIKKEYVMCDKCFIRQVNRAYHDMQLLLIIQSLKNDCNYKYVYIKDLEVDIDRVINLVHDLIMKNASCSLIKETILDKNSY